MADDSVFSHLDGNRTWGSELPVDTQPSRLAT